MILVSEPICHGAEHAPFNAALLATVRHAYPDEEIHFAAEPSHLAEVRQQLPESLHSGFGLHSAPVPPRRAGNDERRSGERALIQRLATQFAGARQWLFSGSADTTFSALGALRDRELKRRTLAVLHGNLSEITGWRSRNPLVRRKDLRSGLERTAIQGVRFLVLEHAIGDALRAEMPNIAQNVHVLEHPIIADAGATGADAPEPPGQPPVRVGFLGMANSPKGFDLFLKVAERVKQHCPEGIQFHTIGPRAPDMEPADWAALDTPPWDRWLSAEEYREGVLGMNFVIMPYQAQHYRWSASGVLLDAIRYGRPVIALRNPVMENLFQRHGDIGYLCDQDNHMVVTISERLRHPDPAHYRAQRKALARMLEARQPETLAPTYRAIANHQDGGGS
ncbi:MAG: glycosyltransferase [Gammaproteobacteria bacterium]